MSRLFKPNGTMTEMTQFEQMTKAYRNAMPQEFATAVNLMAHPVAGFAAAGALGLGMASHAMGLWLGAVAGMAEASHRMLGEAADAPPATASRPATLKLVSSTPAPQAAVAAARTVVAEAERVARKAVDAASEVVQTPVAETKPAIARKAKARVADDLKAIAGIGPKLEKVLNGLGISTYEQVARLTKAEIAKLDDQLGFSGRIERDDWLGQARKLAGE